jgi:DNA-binding transcriptional MerR regulator
VDKSPDAFRTISEVADDLDMPQHVLRFWETRFTQIKPLKRGGGRRYYRPDDVDLLKGLRRLLYGEGYTIKGVQRILKEQGARHVVAIGRGAPVARASDSDGEAQTTLAAPVASPASAAPRPALAYASPLTPGLQAELAEPDSPFQHEPAPASRPALHGLAPALPLDSANRLKAALFELGEARADLARIGSAQMASGMDD